MVEPMPLYAKLFTFLPPIVCWIFANSLLQLRKKSPTNWYTLSLSICAFIYTVSDAFYLTGSQEKGLLAASNILTSCTASLIPVLAIFTELSMLHIDRKKYHLDLLLLVPILWISTLITLLFTTQWSELVSYEELMRNSHQIDILKGNYVLPDGIEARTYRLYSILFETGILVVLSVEVVAALIFTIYQLHKRKKSHFEVSKMLFRDGETTPHVLYAWGLIALFLSSIFRYVINTPFMLDHYGWIIAYSIVLATILYCIFYVSSAYSLPYVTQAILFHPNYFRSVEHEESVENIGLQEQQDTQLSATTSDSASTLPKQEEMVQAPAYYQGEATAQDHEILQRVQTLMSEDHLFLNPHITIEEIASEIDSNRVYVSRAINNILGVSFRDYISNIRIEYAKQYMMAHPMETQESIATNCGYHDATSFNKKFRQLTQLTPREWMDTQGYLS